MTGKTKSIESTVYYLSRTFDKITSNMPKAARDKSGKPNELYKHQVEFAYRLNELMRAPDSIRQFYLTACNDYIDHLISTQK